MRSKPLLILTLLVLLFSVAKLMFLDVGGGIDVNKILG